MLNSPRLVANITLITHIACEKFLNNEYKNATERYTKELPSVNKPEARL
jgi:hypothetical protein